ncbi:MAG: outer membrane beta-barrel protein, partial [Sodaliphilus sp.]|nr:outer membrane beta-barrel protein [Sodaliphilus sp.]
KTADLKDNTNAVDFGLGLGGTFNVTDNLFVQARYTMGFTKVFDGDQDIKNGNIFVGLGYKF